MSFVLSRIDAAPPRSVEDTAMAIAQRTASITPFDPTAAGVFTHATTATSTTVPTDLTFSLSSGSTIADLVASSSALYARMNQVVHLVNQVIYVLEANGMTS